ncbi:unnamed protein product [Pelagomonas calceolata]|uniref:Steroid 5-alpha reductase C-terminal domain-containing protein n=1 Tax=Pelagomonas calceolata TaxID=35677 RepID=A0A8J2SAC0_9STRA|nr:unnamed protein product [Pelagomonas calceolata]
MAIKDAWRFDKSQWALKAGIASALVLATIAWLIPAIECNDQTLLVFGIVYIPIVYVFFIPSIFYTMARGKVDECSAPVTAAAIVLYVVGSGFSTIGESQRYIFKKQPANKGKLMTGGLWSLTMHANYFGDTLLFTGWTLASSGLAVSWTWWAVPVMTALFVFMHIPGLDEYLADRYPKEFPKYAATTAKFVPFVY